MKIPSPRQSCRRHITSSWFRTSVHVKHEEINISTAVCSWLTNPALTENIWRLQPIVFSCCVHSWDGWGKDAEWRRGKRGCYDSHNPWLGDGNAVWLATSVTWRAGWQPSKAAVTSAWPPVMVVVVVAVGGGGGGGVGWAAVAASMPKGCPLSL